MMQKPVCWFIRFGFICIGVGVFTQLVFVVGSSAFVQGLDKLSADKLTSYALARATLTADFPPEKTKCGSSPSYVQGLPWPRRAYHPAYTPPCQPLEQGKMDNRALR